MTTRRRDTVTLVPGISGAQGTLSHEIRLRSGDFDALIEALKPEMRGQVEGLPLHEDASKLIERIKEFTGRISFGGAERVRAEFTSLVDRIVSAQSRTNALAAQARKSQSTVIADAVREEMREKLANYGRQCLRDRYVETLSATYAPEIAAGDLRVVAWLPDAEAGERISATWKDVSSVIDRSFCLVTSSRTIMVTIGVRDFDIIVSKASGSAIADGEYGGGSWVKRDANALTDIILHLPELRYFARQVVEAHAKMPDIVRTYEAYTLARSHEIEAKLAGVVAQIFPLYAKWKKAHKPGHEHLSETTNWHSGTKSVIDSILKLFDGRLVSSPHWAAGRGDVGPQMSVVAKSYLSWHALRAIAEITVELEKARSELAEVSKIGLGSLIYDKKPAVAAKEARVRGLEKILEELSVARSYDSRTPTTNGENTPSEGKQTLNFVQATCGEMVREKLREIYIKPFFEKLDLVYGADRQIGRVKDGSITIPSETHVKIAFGGGDGMPSYTGYASVWPSARTRHFAQERQDANRLAPGEFARLIVMSMPHLTDESKDGAHSVEIDRAYSAFMEHEVSLRFGQVPEGRRILPPHISGQYRIHGYHVKNDPHA